MKKPFNLFGFYCCSLDLHLQYDSHHPYVLVYWQHISRTFPSPKFLLGSAVNMRYIVRKAYKKGNGVLFYLEILLKKNCVFIILRHWCVLLCC